MILDLQGPFVVTLDGQDVSDYVHSVRLVDVQPVDQAHADQVPPALAALIRDQLRPGPICHTCSGTDGRLTTGMVCLECGTDYSTEPPTRGPRAPVRDRWLIIGDHLDVNTYVDRERIPPRSWVCGCRNDTITRALRGIAGDRVTIVYLASTRHALDAQAQAHIETLTALGATVVDQRNANV